MRRARRSDSHGTTATPVTTPCSIGISTSSCTFGPIVAGATMMDHVEDFLDYEELGAGFLTSIPGSMEGQQDDFWTTDRVGQGGRD